MSLCERCQQATATVRHEDIELCADCYELRRTAPPTARTPMALRATPRPAAPPRDRSTTTG